MMNNKPRNATFTLEERLTLLKIIKPHIGVIDSVMNDFSMNSIKSSTWTTIAEEFITVYPCRHNATAKDIRELWRRMKHRARMEVRAKVRKAKLAKVCLGQDVDHRGWVPDSNQTVLAINDLGLEPDTKAITDFVPLLEEEATVVETRNGIVQTFSGSVGQSVSKNSAINASATSTSRTPDEQVEIHDAMIYDEVLIEEENEEDIVEVVPECRQGEVKVEQIESTDFPDQPQDSNSSSSPADVMEVPSKPVIKRESIEPHPLPPASAFPTPPPCPPSLRSQPPPPPPAQRLHINAKGESGPQAVELHVRLTNLRAEHTAKMALIKLKMEAAKAKSESARAKRAAYDEKRMYYFEKRKELHSDMT
ncbi:uncharacterized protein [Diadema setosum]|uniref:uncharacterized protein n=1 Tax=Diadema setosum TaxID=31175 RepID=UPI003B3BA5AC